MSFVSDFKTIIEADPSINAMVTGDIKFSHLPEDFDIRKTWIVWDFRSAVQNDTLGHNNCFTQYSIAITVTATDSVVMNNLSDLVVDYLNRTTSSTFIDIAFVSDSKITSLNKPANVYQNALEFNAIYVG